MSRSRSRSRSRSSCLLICMPVWYLGEQWQLWTPNWSSLRSAYLLVAVQYSALHCSGVKYIGVQCSAVRFRAVQRSSLRFSAVQYISCSRPWPAGLACGCQQSTERPLTLLVTLYHTVSDFITLNHTVSDVITLYQTVSDCIKSLPHCTTLPTV